MSLEDRIRDEMMVESQSRLEENFERVGDLIDVRQDGSVRVGNSDGLTWRQRALLILIGSRFAHEVGAADSPEVSYSELYSRLDISKSSIRNFIGGLRDQDVVEKPDGDWIYRPVDLSEIDDIGFPRHDLEQPREGDDSFLGDVEPRESSYEDLVESVERTYASELYSATMVLTRKLFENLLVDIMRGKYGIGDSLDEFYDENRGRFRGFAVILENFGENAQAFKPYDTSLAQGEFLSEIDDFREEANADAHSISTTRSSEEMEKYSRKARKIAKVLFHAKRRAVEE